MVARWTVFAADRMQALRLWATGWRWRRFCLRLFFFLLIALLYKPIDPFGLSTATNTYSQMIVQRLASPFVTLGNEGQVGWCEWSAGLLKDESDDTAATDPNSQCGEDEPEVFRQVRDTCLAILQFFSTYFTVFLDYINEALPQNQNPETAPQKIDRHFAALPPAVVVNWTDDALADQDAGWPVQYSVHGMVIRNILRTGPSAVFVDLKFTNFRHYDKTAPAMACDILQGMFEALPKSKQPMALDLLSKAPSPDYTSLRGLFPPVYFATGYKLKPQMIWDKAPLQCPLPAIEGEDDFMSQLTGLADAPTFPFDPSQLFRLVPTGWSTNEPGYSLSVPRPEVDGNADPAKSAATSKTAEEENSFATLLEAIGIAAPGSETTVEETEQHPDPLPASARTPAASLALSQLERGSILPNLLAHAETALNSRMILKWPYDISKSYWDIFGQDSLRGTCGDTASPAPAQIWILGKEIWRLIVNSLLTEGAVFDPLQRCPYNASIDVSMFFNAEDGPRYAGDFEANLSWLPEHTGGKTVFYGADISADEDEVMTPVNGQIAGVYYHAAAYENLRWLGTGYVRQNKTGSLAVRYVALLVLALSAAIYLTNRDRRPAKESHKPYRRTPDLLSLRKQRRRAPRLFLSRPRNDGGAGRPSVYPLAGAPNLGKKSQPAGNGVWALIRSLGKRANFALATFNLGLVAFGIATLAYCVFDLAPIDFLGLSFGFAVFRLIDGYIVSIAGFLFSE